MRKTALVAAAALAGSVPLAQAEVRPNPLFSDNAVLQQGREVPVWGTARSGEKITVEIAGQRATATAEQGRWMVHLKPLRAGGPHVLTIRGDNTVRARNVLVGDVWICSGQSNMQWPVSASANAQEMIASSADPQLRLLTVPREGADIPRTEVAVKWDIAGPSTVPGFSAVAFAFGQHLRKHRRVPVGLINTSYGGTPAEAWTSREALRAVPELTHYLLQGNRRNDPGRPTALYNAMIAPLIPYAISGAIWYQGESNADRAWEYRTLFPTMIQNWRRDWGQGDFPFLFVQLAPFMKIQPEPMESAWAELRDAQLYTSQTVPNTAMAVIVDVGDETDIHPKAKQPVGERQALAARALAYGEHIPWSGPVVAGVQRLRDRIRIRFKHTYGGLTTGGQEPAGFTIAGANGRFRNARALVHGDTVTVWSENVPRPREVRYGWANYPVVNLRNGAGLYASPFRTDRRPYTTMARR